MKIVHLMKNEKFLKGIVRFYDHFFNNEEHEILYYRKENDPLLLDFSCSIPQIEFEASSSNDLITYLQNLKCDYIVLHSLFLTTKEKVKLLFNRRLYKKLIWIEWGADLYSWKCSFGMKNLIKNQVNFHFRNGLRKIICIFPPDVEYFYKAFPQSKGECFYAPYKGYPIDDEFGQYSNESKLTMAKKNNEPIYIQIGQNALESLNHIRVLEKLEKFKNENIRLFLPLSYGGQAEYVERVEKCAEKLFPGKVIILRDFMSSKQYFEMTKKIAIAIFDTERQCGLGNIHRFNFRNVKVFLAEQGQMYAYFIERGVPVCKCEDIEKMSYAEFISQTSIKDTNKFGEYIKELSDMDIAVKQWNEIYENLRCLDVK